jgi:FkbM family methyltransferase
LVVSPAGVGGGTHASFVSSARSAEVAASMECSSFDGIRLRHENSAAFIQGVSDGCGGHTLALIDFANMTDGAVKFYSHPGHDQDEWVIKEVFPGRRGGWFIDSGAGPDGISNSNTYALETQFGWTGLLVEPHPQRHPEVVKNRSSIIEMACLTDKAGDVTFTLNQDAPGTSGILGEMSEPNRVHAGFDRKEMPSITVPGIPLWELLRRHDAPKVIEYLSLDIEGAEWLALKDFPFDEFRILAMTIERGGRDYVRLARKLRGEGYRLAKVRGPDDFFYHESLDYRPSLSARMEAAILSTWHTLYFMEPFLTIRRAARFIRSKIRGY